MNANMDANETQNIIDRMIHEELHQNKSYQPKESICRSVGCHRVKNAEVKQ